jgi:hypothetical protein
MARKFCDKENLKRRCSEAHERDGSKLTIWFKLCCDRGAEGADAPPLAEGPVPFTMGRWKLGAFSPGPMLALRGTGLGRVGADIFGVIGG